MTRAWAAAPDFRWDATSVRGVLCQAYYQWPKAGPEWEQAAEGTQWTIRMYSELLSPFPYPQATSVAGTVSGMEYPMFVMDGYTDPESPGDVFRVNYHEHGHEWFGHRLHGDHRVAEQRPVHDHQHGRCGYPQVLDWDRRERHPERLPDGQLVAASLARII